MPCSDKFVILSEAKDPENKILRLCLRMTGKDFLRLTSFATALVFLVNNVHSYSATVSASISLPPQLQKELHLNQVVLPSGIGRIEEIFDVTSENTSPQVILIQNAHAIKDAQKNIQKIIGHFQKQYGVNFVGVEGAASALDAQIFKSFPDKELLKKVFTEYFEKGELTGVVASAIFDEQCRGTACRAPTSYYGVEEWSLYEKGLSLYQEAMEKESGILQKLEARSKKLEEKKKKIYSKELFEADEAVEEFYKDTKSFVETLQKLEKIKKLEVGSELALILEESKGQEKDSAEIEREVRQLAEKINNLAGPVRGTSHSSSERSCGRMGALPPCHPQDYAAQRDFNQKYQEFQTSRISAVEFAVWMKENVVRRGAVSAPGKTNDGQGLLSGRGNPAPTFSPRLFQLIQNQKRLQNLQGTKLFRDFERYAQEVKNSLIRSDNERELDQKTRELWLMERLVKLELTRGEWETVKNVGATHRVALRRARHASPLHKLFSAHFSFYHNAEQREQAMFKNLLKLFTPSSFHLPPSSNVLFVAGGFHTQGLTQRLKQNNISYALITPHIDSVPEKTHYRDHMRGEVSWKNYFEVENGKINFYKAFVRATRDQLLRSHKVTRTQGHKVKEDPAFTCDSVTCDLVTLKHWRDQIIRDLAVQERLTEAKNYTQFLDEVVVQKKNEKSLTTKLQKIDEFIAKLRGLDNSGQLTTPNILKILSPSTIEVAISNLSLSPRDYSRIESLPQGFGGLKIPLRSEARMSVAGLSEKEQELIRTYKDLEIELKSRPTLEDMGNRLKVTKQAVSRLLIALRKKGIFLRTKGVPNYFTDEQLIQAYKAIKTESKRNPDQWRIARRLNVNPARVSQRIDALLTKGIVLVTEHLEKEFLQVSKELNEQLKRKPTEKEIADYLITSRKKNPNASRSRPRKRIITISRLSEILAHIKSSAGILLNLHEQEIRFDQFIKDERVEKFLESLESFLRFPASSVNPYPSWAENRENLSSLIERIRSSRQKRVRLMAATFLETELITLLRKIEESVGEARSEARNKNEPIQLFGIVKFLNGLGWLLEQDKAKWFMRKELNESLFIKSSPEEIEEHKEYLRDLIGKRIDEGKLRSLKIEEIYELDRLTRHLQFRHGTLIPIINATDEAGANVNLPHASLSIKEYAPKDYEAMSALEESVELPFLGFKWSPTKLSEEFQNGIQVIIVKDNDKLVGFALYRQEREKIMLIKIVTDAHYDEFGIREQVIQTIKNKLIPNGPSSIWIYIPESRTDIQMFLARRELGFKATRILPNYYVSKKSGRTESAYEMKFWVSDKEPVDSLSEKPKNKKKSPPVETEPKEVSASKIYEPQGMSEDDIEGNDFLVDNPNDVESGRSIRWEKGIRWMIRRDWPEVLTIEQNKRLKGLVPWTEEDFIIRLRQRNIIGRVTEIDEKVVGYMVYHLNKNSIDILAFGVDPQYRDRGIGRAMIELLKYKLSQQGRTYIRVAVRESALEAHLYFQALEFFMVRIMRNHFSDTKEDGYVFQYSLPGFGPTFPIQSMTEGVRETRGRRAEARSTAETTELRRSYYNKPLESKPLDDEEKRRIIQSADSMTAWVKAHSKDPRQMFVIQNLLDPLNAFIRKRVVNSAIQFTINSFEENLKTREEQKIYHFANASGIERYILFYLFYVLKSTDPHRIMVTLGETPTTMNGRIRRLRNDESFKAKINGFLQDGKITQEAIEKILDSIDQPRNSSEFMQGWIKKHTPPTIKEWILEAIPRVGAILKYELEYAQFFNSSEASLQAHRSEVRTEKPNEASKWSEQKLRSWIEENTKDAQKQDMLSLLSNILAILNDPELSTNERKSSLIIFLKEKAGFEKPGPLVTQLFKAERSQKTQIEKQKPQSLVEELSAKMKALAEEIEAAEYRAAAQAFVDLFERIPQMDKRPLTLRSGSAMAYGGEERGAIVSEEFVKHFPDLIIQEHLVHEGSHAQDPPSLLAYNQARHDFVKTVPHHAFVRGNPQQALTTDKAFMKTILNVIVTFLKGELHAYAHSDTFFIQAVQKKHGSIEAFEKKFTRFSSKAASQEAVRAAVLKGLIGDIRGRLDDNGKPDETKTKEWILRGFLKIDWSQLKDKLAKVHGDLLLLMAHFHLGPSVIQYSGANPIVKDYSALLTWIESKARELNIEEAVHTSPQTFLLEKQTQARARLISRNREMVQRFIENHYYRFLKKRFVENDPSVDWTQIKPFLEALMLEIGVDSESLNQRYRHFQEYIHNKEEWDYHQAYYVNEVLNREIFLPHDFSVTSIRGTHGHEFLLAYGEVKENYISSLSLEDGKTIKIPSHVVEVKYPEKYQTIPVGMSALFAGDRLIVFEQAVQVELKFYREVEPFVIRIEDSLQNRGLEFTPDHLRHIEIRTSQGNLRFNPSDIGMFFGFHQFYRKPEVQNRLRAAYVKSSFLHESTHRWVSYQMGHPLDLLQAVDSSELVMIADRIAVDENSRLDALNQRAEVLFHENQSRFLQKLSEEPSLEGKERIVITGEETLVLLTNIIEDEILYTPLVDKLGSFNREGSEREAFAAVYDDAQNFVLSEFALRLQTQSSSSNPVSFSQVWEFLLQNPEKARLWALELRRREFKFPEKTEFKLQPGYISSSRILSTRSEVRSDFDPALEGGENVQQLMRQARNISGQDEFDAIWAAVVVDEIIEGNEIALEKKRRASDIMAMIGVNQFEALLKSVALHEAQPQAVQAEQKRLGHAYRHFIGGYPKDTLTFGIRFPKVMSQPDLKNVTDWIQQMGPDTLVVPQDIPFLGELRRVSRTHFQQLDFGLPAFVGQDALAVADLEDDEEKGMDSMFRRVTASGNNLVNDCLLRAETQFVQMLTTGITSKLLENPKLRENRLELRAELLKVLGPIYSRVINAQGGGFNIDPLEIRVLNEFLARSEIRKSA